MTGTTCIFCNRGSDQTPILTLEYQGGTFRICAQHLPVLIHNPQELIGMLPGAERLEPSTHQD